MALPRIAAALAACLLGTRRSPPRPIAPPVVRGQRHHQHRVLYRARQGRGFVRSLRQDAARGLPAHPTPDRTALAESRVKAIESTAPISAASASPNTTIVSQGRAADPCPPKSDDKDALASNASLAKA